MSVEPWVRVMNLCEFLLTLFFCRTCSALLTLFKAWTLVEPFSFPCKYMEQLAMTKSKIMLCIEIETSLSRWQNSLCNSTQEPKEPNTSILNYSKVFLCGNFLWPYWMRACCFFLRNSGCFYYDRGHSLWINLKMLSWHQTLHK